MLKVTVKESGNWRKTVGDLKERANALHGKHQIPLKDLLTPEFISASSSYATLDNLFAASPFKIENVDDFKAIPDAEWDTFISSHTNFASWEEMQQAAVREYVRKQLGFQ